MVLGSPQVVDVLVQCVCQCASMRDDKIQMHVVRYRACATFKSNYSFMAKSNYTFVADLGVCCNGLRKA